MPIIGNPIYQSAFVVDQFSGNGSTVAFTMSVAPAGVTNVLVSVSGVLQDPSTYGVVGNTITFSAAPPSGTGNISCRYLGIPVTGVTTTAYRTVTEFTATASQTTFTPPSYTVGFINVYLNGVLLGSADYTATNGTTVVLTTGASAGNLVTVESFLVSSVLNAIPNTAGSVSSSNIFDGAVTPAKLSTGGPYWDTSSNVGIGTTSPAEKLHVSSGAIRISNTSNSLLELNTNAGNRFGYLFGTSSSVQLAAESTANNVLSFSTNNTEQARITSAGLLQFNSGYGSVATAYGCRAWVNFNGTGTPAIRASGNVSSITDNGSGDYTVNLTTAMPDGNYSAVSSGGTGSNNIRLSSCSPVTTTSTSQIRVLGITVGAGSLIDLEVVSVAIFR